MNGQRLTADRWRDLIRQQSGSGQSIEAFCRQHGLAVSTFFVWRRKLKTGAVPTFVELTSSAEPTAATPQVIEVKNAPSLNEGADAPPPIELLLAGGLIVRVRDGFDAATLRQVVEALQ